MKQNPSSMSPWIPPHSKDGQGRRLGCACSRTTDLILSQMVWAKRSAVFQKLSLTLFCLLLTHLKPVPVRIIFLKSNTSFVKSGSTKVLKDFFFNESKKKTNMNCIPNNFEPEFISSCSHSQKAQSFNITTSWQIAQGMFGLEEAWLRSSLRVSSHYTKVLGSVSSQST